MKTIEQKAIAYDKVRKKIAIRFGSNVADEFFAEFEGSMDEEIRKALKQYFVNSFQNNGVAAICGVHVKDVLAWLEKQGDYANFRDKAQVGDRITKNEDGVLVNLSQLKRVAKPREKQGAQKFEMKTAEESLGIDSDTYNKIVDECILGEQKPKENKGNIGGISPTWSEEDEKNLRRAIRATKVVYPVAADWLQSLQDRVQPQPKQEWKQENTGDLTAFENAMMHIGGSFFGQHAGLDPNDTNSIKEQANLLLELVPSKEWSDVDKDILFCIINDLKFLRDTISIDPKYAVNIIDMEREITWLKSLKPQSRWKPTGEQMGCLSDAIEHYNSLGYSAPKLKELLDDLKKIKEGNV